MHELLVLDHEPTIRRRAARMLPPHGLSLPPLRGRRSGRNEAVGGSGVAGASPTLVVNPT
jgi:hypothetical protein